MDIVFPITSEHPAIEATINKLSQIASLLADAESDYLFKSIAYDAKYAEVQYEALKIPLFTDKKTGELRCADTIKEQDIAIALWVQRDETLRNRAIEMEQAKITVNHYRNDLESCKALAKIFSSSN